MKIANQFLNVLPNEMVAFYKAHSYFVTEAEAKLFNVINQNHSDFSFGRVTYNIQDVLVKLEDALQFHSFLILCYNTIFLKKPNDSGRCGFIRIGGESVLPFTLHQAKKCVPLFYLEEVSDQLKSSSAVVKGWDLAYLKLCCKVQGIKPVLFQPDECHVVPLDLIKTYFPGGTKFEDYWPDRHKILPSTDKRGSVQSAWIVNPSNVQGNNTKPASHETLLKSNPTALEPKTCVINQNNLQQQKASWEEQAKRASLYPNTAKRDASWITEAAQESYKRITNSAIMSR